MINAQNYARRLQSVLDATRHVEFRRCLVFNNCNHTAIKAHSVSRAILATIQHDGHLIRPTTKRMKDSAGRPQLIFAHEGIRNASTNTFACQQHDALFAPIDTNPVDIFSPPTLELLFYRAVLHEIITLHMTMPTTNWIDKQAPLAFPATLHPHTRLRALMEAAFQVRQHVLYGAPTPLAHLIRRIRSDHPILAAACASGSYDIGVRRGKEDIELTPDEFRREVGSEPNNTWTFTVIPEQREHLVVVSWIMDSGAERYFEHFKTTEGKELEAAASAELLFFCENWFLHPLVWQSYGRHKKAAVVTAYSNFEEMWRGDYRWSDRNPKIPWYKYLKLHNRHQVNLFRYDENLFQQPS